MTNLSASATSRLSAIMPEGGREVMKVLRVIVCSIFLITLFAAVSVAGPTEVFAPTDLKITPPNAHLPEDIKAFYGETGKWWGTWYGNPPGHMEAILIIKKIVDSKTAEILYIIPNYQTWGIKGFTAERIAKFEKKDGKTYLVMPPSSNGQLMQFTFDTGVLVGVIEGPYLTANIVWEPLQ
jgi:hypothetical protein